MTREAPPSPNQISSLSFPLQCSRRVSLRTQMKSDSTCRISLFDSVIAGHQRFVSLQYRTRTSSSPPAYISAHHAFLDFDSGLF